MVIKQYRKTYRKRLPRKNIAMETGTHKMKFLTRLGRLNEA